MDFHVPKNSRTDGYALAEVLPIGKANDLPLEVAMGALDWHHCVDVGWLSMRTLSLHRSCKCDSNDNGCPAQQCEGWQHLPALFAPSFNPSQVMLMHRLRKL